MPASGKILKNQQYAKNRAAGIGDESGRLPARVKAEEKNAKCSFCGIEIRMTKTNTEIKQHAESKHSKNTFAECFPGVDMTAGGTAGGAAKK